MDVEFYNVKKREKIIKPVSECTRKIYRRETEKGVQLRYAICSCDDGTNLTKFANKGTFDSLDCPIQD
jgi:hypothetical protein